jgi:tRNA nucleotidyltransferase (CCA-adding enzyme)
MSQRATDGLRLEDAPEAVRWITRTLEDAGNPTWAVGGAVRDRLAGLPAGDWDLTTRARPGEVRRIFRRTVPVGIEHGTVGVLARDGHMYEVTTFRRDVETFGRKARVVFADRLEEDLARRDFTINAVAWHPLRGELADPFGGVADLADRRLRTVGDPDERFAEDRLRVLRALRFAGRFGLEIDPDTWAAIRRSPGTLAPVSAERIREELFKVMADPSPARSLELYAASGVLADLYPELEAVRAAGSGAWERTVAAVAALSPRRPVLRVAALFLCADAEPGRRAALARSVLQRLRCSNAEVDLATHLLAHTGDLPDADASDAEIRRWLSRLGREHLRDALRLSGALSRARGEDPTRFAALARRIRRHAASPAPLTVAELAIGGQELREMGLRPGPEYGRILRDLLDAVLEDPSLNRDEVLRGRVREMSYEL